MEGAGARRRFDRGGHAAFFQDSGLMAALERSIFPRILEGRASHLPVRIWVAGCSTGEALYSVLFVLAEILSANRLEVPIRMFGTDVDPERIDRAQKGVYDAAIAKSLSPARLQRFFVETEGANKVRQSMRDKCVFARHDVTCDPGFPKLDLVIARALPPAVQRRARPGLHRALQPGGFAVLGPVEEAGPIAGLTMVDAALGLFARGPDPEVRPEPVSRRDLLSQLAQLRAENREAAASHEDLLQANEELQATREELSTANEELRAANEELSVRAAETSRLSDDLTNVFASAGIPLLLLDREGRIRRFTPPAAKVFALIDRDVGRPFADIASRLPARTEDLVAAAADVLSRLSPIVELVQDVEGRWHQVTLRPYLNGDGAIDGTVIAIVDIDPMKRREQAAEAQVAEYEEKLRAMAFDAALTEDRERRRIAADLHDRIGQSLALAQIRLGALRDALPAEARAAIVECLEVIEQSVADTRALIFDLSPPVLYDLGLTAAIAWLGDQLAARHGLEVSVEGERVTGLDGEVAPVLFRVVRELLTNVVKHARSPRARVVLGRDEGHLSVEVQDCGVGLAEVRAASSGRGGFGLFSVREQVGRLGGAVEIVPAPGGGTCVRLRVPLGGYDGGRPPIPPARPVAMGGDPPYLPARPEALRPARVEGSDEDPAGRRSQARA